ncbi:HAD family hydrolase [Calothrix sp. PCC 6303]|uniref:HAD family hydrolase n=1 Tax=Calothrix sp. PCC 6303 TaxID=1170562 RepID=UPI0002A03CFE|nr:HAD family phosphatase [Calothrix sp. PCC 6303]AFZ00336.1 HAD-superfamily hydrolase, subfamily IA, variant 3 [Calothrix sp. PCC 6303]
MLTAILFDLDGTLVNTDPIHFLAWQKMLSRYGIDIDEAFYKSRISGGLNPEILADILPQLSLQQAEDFAEEKEAMFREMALELQPIEGLSEVIAWSRQHKLKIALVTNAPRANTCFMLELLGLEDTFDLVILAEDEAAAKPDPTPYQVALQRLGVKIENAIALEDSPSGIRSATGADLRTIGVASTHEPQKLLHLGAFMAISDFTDLEFWGFLTSEMADNLVTDNT